MLKKKANPLKKKDSIMSPKGFGASTPRFDLEPIVLQIKRININMMKKSFSSNKVSFNLNVFYCLLVY